MKRLSNTDSRPRLSNASNETIKKPQLAVVQVKLSPIANVPLTALQAEAWVYAALADNFKQTIEAKTGLRLSSYRSDFFTGTLGRYFLLDYSGIGKTQESRRKELAQTIPQTFNRTVKVKLDRWGMSLNALVTQKVMFFDTGHVVTSAVKRFLRGNEEYAAKEYFEQQHNGRHKAKR